MHGRVKNSRHPVFLIWEGANLFRYNSADSTTVTDGRTQEENAKTIGAGELSSFWECGMPASILESVLGEESC